MSAQIRILAASYLANVAPLRPEELAPFGAARRFGERMDAATAVAAREVLLPSDKQLAAAARRFAAAGDERFDADAFSVAFNEELKHVMTEVLKQPMPEYPFASGDVLPFNTEVALGKKLYEYHLLEYRGHAEVLNSYAWRQLPTVDVAGDAQVGYIKRFGCAWTITEDDELAQQHTKIKLSTEKPIAAKRAHHELWDRHMAWGFEEGKLLGALNHPNVPVIDAPLNSDATSTYWVDKSADEIVADIRLFIRHLPGLTNEIEKITDVYMSPSEYTLISTRKMSTASDTTILEFIEKAFKSVKFHELSTLRVDLSFGNLETNCLWGRRADPSASSLVVVEPFRQRAPIVDGLEKVMICTSGHGAALIKRPYSLVRMDGVGLN